mgnify:CR=1 FL=1
MSALQRTLLVLLLAVLGFGARAQEPADNMAGPYVPTPWPIVDELLKLADLGPQDRVYDLGSGDGRLVLTAARRFGASGLGIELQQALVDKANAETAKEGLSSRVRFVQGDLFEASYRDATVVTLYLLPRFVTRLVPKLRDELKPGARIISHDYPLSPWPADKTLTFDVDEKEAITGSKRTVLYYYVVPARVGGQWTIDVGRALGEANATLALKQGVDSLAGDIVAGARNWEIRDPVVRGERIRFGLLAQGRLMQFTGTVAGDRITGEYSVSGTTERLAWSAQRQP